MSPADCKLEHVFDVEVLFGADRAIFGPLPSGSSQGYTPAIGGTISGPRLSGKVVPHSGADYATVRVDGVIELKAHYLLEADDGTRIYIENKGFLVRPAPGDPQPSYFRLTPYFRVPQGPHDWLERTVIVGGGERRTDPDRTLFRYYALR
ncbi:DUF3237 domain-containing protein [Aurantiacibacter xanthus]|uniref:UPF0311 protein D2V17_19070 n=1 Tax=Aurantiacibacter xanthus TaxID=1784712 RepID=A0A3A1P0B7_9SPHN|nr:DUF3237 domain-containing protein [Aurantiacibacter xanthus]RIV80619.1 DUF3237 domain-containing protein [Aurantiacibacter xanthus]